MTKVFSHVNCLKLYNSWEQSGFLYLQTELCICRYIYCNFANTSLEQILSQRVLSESESVLIVRQLANGLDFIHKNELIHLDIKPSNILVDDQGIVKISDFGMSITSNDLHPDLLNDYEGDCLYLAPEVLNGKPTSYSDIFSLGLVFLQLLSGVKQLPSFGESWQKLRRGDISDYAAYVPQPYAHFISSSLLNPDPFSRASAEEILLFLSE